MVLKRSMGKCPCLFLMSVAAPLFTSVSTEPRHLFISDIRDIIACKGVFQLLSVTLIFKSAQEHVNPVKRAGINLKHWQNKTLSLKVIFGENSCELFVLKRISNIAKLFAKWSEVLPRRSSCKGLTLYFVSCFAA